MAKLRLSPISAVEVSRPVVEGEQARKGGAGGGIMTMLNADDGPSGVMGSLLLS